VAENALDKGSDSDIVIVYYPGMLSFLSIQMKNKKIEKEKNNKIIRMLKLSMSIFKMFIRRVSCKGIQLSGISG
jgi:hypothetical protein